MRQSNNSSPSGRCTKSIKTIPHIWLLLCFRYSDTNLFTCLAKTSGVPSGSPVALTKEIAHQYEELGSAATLCKLRIQASIFNPTSSSEAY